MLILLQCHLPQGEVRVKGDVGFDRVRLKYLDLADFTKAYDRVNTLRGRLPDLSFPIFRSGMMTMAWWSDSSLRSTPAIRGWERFAMLWLKVCWPWHLQTWPLPCMPWSLKQIKQHKNAEPHSKSQEVRQT